MFKHDPNVCSLILVTHIVDLESLSFYQVVELVDQYETECIPAVNRTDKVKYIQTSGDLSCNRSIKVSFLSKFSSM